jgi:hypothetical protein
MSNSTVVVQSLRPMRQIRRDNDDLAGGHHHFLLPVVSKPEFQCALDHIRELLVVMGVARHRIALLEGITPNIIRSPVTIRLVIVPFMASEGWSFQR